MYLVFNLCVKISVDLPSYFDVAQICVGDVIALGVD